METLNFKQQRVKHYKPLIILSLLLFFLIFYIPFFIGLGNFFKGNNLYRLSASCLISILCTLFVFLKKKQPSFSAALELNTEGLIYSDQGQSIAMAYNEITAITISRSKKYTTSIVYETASDKIILSCFNELDFISTTINSHLDPSCKTCFKKVSIFTLPQMMMVTGFVFLLDSCITFMALHPITRKVSEEPSDSPMALILALLMFVIAGFFHEKYINRKRHGITKWLSPFRIVFVCLIVLIICMGMIMLIHH